MSFQHIRQLLIRTSRSITPEDELGYPNHSEEALRPEDKESKLELKLAHQRQREDNVIRTWVVFPPPSLREVRIWTQAFVGRTNGEHMAVWMLQDNEWPDNEWDLVDNHPIKGEEVCGGDFV